MNRLFGIAVVGFLLAVGSLGHVVPSPALLWTSSQRDIQVPGSSLNTHRFEDLTSSLLSDDEVDLVVIYTAPEVRDDLKIARIQSTVQAQYSTIAFPYVISSTENSAAFALQQKVANKELLHGGVGESSLEDIEAQIRLGKALVVVYELPADLDVQLDVISRLNSAASARSDFAALYASSQPNEQALSINFQAYMFSHSKRQLARRASTTNSDGTTVYSNYWPGGVLEGVITGFTFLFIAVLGICCMAAIQSQERFDKPPKKIAIE